MAVFDHRCKEHGKMTALGGRQWEEMVAVEQETEGVFKEIQALSRHLLHPEANEISASGSFSFVFPTIS